MAVSLTPDGNLMSLARRLANGTPVVLLLLGYGCAPGEAPPAVTVRDSAGVAIVESRRPAWKEGGGWNLAPEPTLRIGAVEGDPAYQFSDVAGVVRLSDGGIAVADAGSSEIRFFDPRGRFLSAVGGPGEGPGEFSTLAGLGRGPGTWIWAYDFAARRITWLEETGEIRRSTTLAPEPAAVYPVGPLPDRSFVLRQLWGVRRTAEALEEGLRRDPVAFVRFDTAGTLIDTVGLVPGREIYLREEDGRGVMVRPLVGRDAAGTVLSRTEADASGPPATVVVGDQDSFEVRELTPDGRLLRILRIPGRDLSLPAGEYADIQESYVTSAPPEARPDLRRTLEARPRPERRPAHGPIRSDGVGHLWVGAWSRGPSSTWTVLAPDGSWLGDVDVPPGFTLHSIGPDWVAGVETDDMGVEYAVCYELERV